VLATLPFGMTYPTVQNSLNSLRTMKFRSSKLNHIVIQYVKIERRQSAIRLALGPAVTIRVIRLPPTPWKPPWNVVLSARRADCAIVPGFPKCR